MDINREQYERDLLKKQTEHLERISKRNDREWRPCLHDSCTSCHGTGVKEIIWESYLNIWQGLVMAPF